MFRSAGHFEGGSSCSTICIHNNMCCCRTRRTIDVNCASSFGPQTGHSSLRPQTVRWSIRSLLIVEDVVHCPPAPTSSAKPRSTRSALPQGVMQEATAPSATRPPWSVCCADTGPSWRTGRVGRARGAPRCTSCLTPVRGGLRGRWIWQGTKCCYRNNSYKYVMHMMTFTTQL